MRLADRLQGALRRVPAWSLYMGTFLYAAWTFWRGASGGLGPDPVKALEHAYGEAALYMLVAVLAVTPLRRFAGINLLRFRRALGLSCFFLVCAHLLIWAVLDVQSFGRVWADILKRPYITIGMTGFALMIPLAVTSNQRALRRMGAGWRRLHRLTYPAAVLAGGHYLMLVKGWQLKPVVMLAIILLLLAMRLRSRSRTGRG